MKGEWSPFPLGKNFQCPLDGRTTYSESRDVDETEIVCSQNIGCAELLMYRTQTQLFMALRTSGLFCNFMLKNFLQDTCLYENIYV
jgi:hypothetical protein